MTVIAPDDYAAALRFDIDAADALKPRALLTDSGHVGMSSLRCREQIRRTLAKIPQSDSPPRWKAIIGTALHEQVEGALKEAHPDWLYEVNVTAELPSGVKISGTCDWADPSEPSVTDCKTKALLAPARKMWAGERSYRFQRHLLYLGFVQQHGFPEQGIVRNVVLDRTGKDAHPFVWQEPFSMDVVREADEFLSDVWYALDHDETAPRDVEGHECSYCPWFTACRGSDIVTGPITNARLADAVNTYGEAKLARDEAQDVMDGLREVVIGVTGYTDDFKLTTTKIATNGSSRILVSPR